VRELTYAHIVDRLLCYLVMIVGCVFEIDPELIPDSKIRMSEVVACGSLEEMLRQRAHLAASDLSFSTTKLIATALSVPGVAEDSASDARERLGTVVAVRNLLVHHSGIVHAKFVREQPQYADLLGQRFPIDGASIESLTDLAHDVRETIDSAMQDKYGVSAALLLKVADEYRDRANVNDSTDG